MMRNVLTTKFLSAVSIAVAIGLNSFALQAQEHAPVAEEHTSVDSTVAHATATHESAEKPFDPQTVIFEHIGDSHDWHLWGEHENAVSIPLPVILKGNNGWAVFMSSAFYHDTHGTHVVEVNGDRFVNYEGKIYFASETANEHGQYLSMGAENHPTNVHPLDLSLSKNVASMLLSVLIIVLVFTSVARAYKRNPGVAPRGLQSFMEPLILFIQNDVAIPNIGEKNYKRFMPFLLTVFFFILVNNLLGMLPTGANLTGNIAVTLVLAFITFLITNLNGNKAYWGHILWPPGVPFFVKLILIPVEFAGIFIKPVALTIRLFANITAGHIIVISLISLIFIFKTLFIAPVSVAFVLFIDTLELLVAFLQAYIFTMLSALYIGSAMAEHHHDEHEHGVEHAH